MNEDPHSRSNYRQIALIVMANLVILAGYQIHLAVNSDSLDQLASAIYLSIHLLANGFFAIGANTAGKPKVAKGFLLSLVLVAVIGIGTCCIFLK